ncbi:MAG: flagellar biosynthesis anti-sigma factor FlgM [Treponema sp.]|nr:flagellar biosynthesis anti-sigma factor FlgM [Treponema sp.]
MVDRIGQMNPVQMENRIGKGNQVSGGDGFDSISLSAEAVARSEVYRVSELAKAAEGLSDARIAELREKISDPSYFARVREATADKILDAFGV